MKPFWIWLQEADTDDSYGEFYTSFDWSAGEAELRISADSDYTLFLNGQFVDSDQYKDFPWCKVYDRLNITPYLRRGVNHMAVVVWHYGVGNFSYCPGPAGLWYEVTVAGTPVAVSGRETRSRLSRAYRSHAKKNITFQLGFGFFYRADREDGWRSGDLQGFAESRVLDLPAPAIPRPVRKLNVLPRIPCRLVRREGNRRLFDLGHEEVGYLTLSVRSAVPQELKIAWGEHIADGWVRYRIGDRDFSAGVFVSAGDTQYTNYFRRLGARYLELISEAELEVEYLSLLPCPYPLQKAPVSFGDAQTDRIYAVAVRTLELCMHDHYEDCPWREQAMYAMDSRNQMLCGYYAFREFAFPRACLWLMGQDRRADGLLSICTPENLGNAIPSFSLHYILALYEYTLHSGDLTLAKEVLPRAETILAAYLCRMKDGLVPTFTGAGYWNFYEWRDELDGKGSGERFDAVLNCLLSLALDRMQRLCTLLQIDRDEQPRIASLNRRIAEMFYVPEKNRFRNRSDSYGYSELANALAVLCGAAAGSIARDIAGQLASDSNGMTPVSLSMTCFLYDALLQVDRAAYRDYVLEDIRRTYQPMLDAGATSFWETELGEADFHNAGSLCHGWSAMPVYYYHTLLTATAPDGE